MLAIQLRRLALTLPITLAIVALFASGCATTPEPEPAPEPVAAPAEVEPPPAPPPEPVVEVLPSAPEEYVVQKGDTLWDISTRFLKDPWFWPEIWHVNPQVANPHLIYPGDILTLYYIGGRPQISIVGGPRVEAPPPGVPTEKLSPRIRVEEVQRDGIVPVQTIHQFLVEPRVVPEDVLKRAPHIVDSQDLRLAYGAGDQVYVRNLERDPAQTRYTVFRTGGALRDPRTRELLGYEAIHVGEATVVAHGEPATVHLDKTVREALRGDRLLPVEDDLTHTFMPHAPGDEVDGVVVSLFDAISQIGQNQVAVISLGERDGIEKGHVLAIYQTGRRVSDAYARGGLSRRVTLPNERTGLVMVFRTFDKVSYALVMESTRTMKVGDIATNP